MHRHRNCEPTIMVAPTGARRGKDDHPNLPISLPEILAEACACHDAGADWLHLHVRDETGRHSIDPGRYDEALTELARVVPGMPVQITTEAGGLFSVAQQLETLRTVTPRAASIGIREIARSPELAAEVYGFCHEAGTQVQHILHDPADFAQLAQWQASGVIRDAEVSVIFVLGKYAPAKAASRADLDAFLQVCGTRVASWMACAFGPTEQECLLDAARRGGDVRIGFENNILAPDGTRALNTATNVVAFKAALARLTPAMEISQ